MVKDRFFRFSKNSYLDLSETISVKRHITSDAYSIREDLEVKCLDNIEDIEREVSFYDEQEKLIFERVSTEIDKWFELAEKNHIAKKALEYKKSCLEAKIDRHTHNKWDTEVIHDDSYITTEHWVSNKVYSLYLEVKETNFEKDYKKYAVSYSFHIGSAFNKKYNTGACIERIDTRVLESKEELDKYIAGVKEKYNKYFTEVCPAIPKKYAYLFKVNEVLLEGFRLSDSFNLE